jgi:putative ABC transport system permease protein
MSWSRRFFNVLTSNRHSRALDRELEFHIAERIDELVAAGMNPRAAAIEARRRFGNYGAQKEHTRDADILAWFHDLVADLRYALRALRHSPAFAIVAVVSLALGIGANTAIFTLINAAILRSLPVAHPEELVQVTMGTGNATYFTNPIWEQLRDRQDLFTGVFAYAHTSFNLADAGEERPMTSAGATPLLFCHTRSGKASSAVHRMSLAARSTSALTHFGSSGSRSRASPEWTLVRRHRSSCRSVRT